MVNNSRLEAINRLIERMQEVVASPRNRRNKEYWEDQLWYRDLWRGIPARPASRGIPFTIAPDNAFCAEYLPLDLREYYSDPLTHLEYQLRIALFKYEHFEDNTYYDGHIFIWFGVITELSFFGPSITFFANREGWLSGEPLIQREEDLDRLEPPDFYRSGLMPRIHHFYEVIGEVVNGRLPIMFPNWARSPFCMAVHLRGMQNLLMDMLINPDFVHRIMRFVTDSRKNWVKERAKFLGEPIIPGHLFNDEVDCPTISPDLYREFILPYEKELAEFQGGIIYWHSCGNVTNLLELIKQTPNVKMYHIGPWTDLQRAVEVFGDHPLDICIDPVGQLIECDEQQMEVHLRKIVKVCGTERRYGIRADALQVIHSPAADLEKMKTWIKVAQRVCW